MKITASIIDYYARTCSELKTLTKRKDELREAILTSYVTGVTIPAGTSCVIDFQHTTRREIDWKQQAIDLAKIIHGNAWPAWVLSVETTAPTSEIIRVVPKPVAGIAKAS